MIINCFSIFLPLSSLYTSDFPDFLIWFSMTFPFVSGTSAADMEDKNIKVPHRKYINPETDLLYNKKKFLIIQVQVPKHRKRNLDKKIY